MKKTLLVLLLVLIVVVSFVGCADKQTQLVKNGRFEELTNNIPNDWKLFENDEEYESDTEFKFVEDNFESSNQYIPELGKKQLKVSVSLKVSEAYMSQKVKLNAGSVYKLSVYINVSSDISGENKNAVYIGARVGFLEDEDFKAIDVKKKTDGWQLYEVFIRSNTQRDLTMVVGIGDENIGLAKGSAMFGAVSLEKVDENVVPNGSTIHNVKYGSSYNLSDGKSTTYIVLCLAILLIVSYLFYFIIRRSNGGYTNSLLNKNKFFKTMLSPMATFIYVLFTAFLLRFIIVLALQGQGMETENLSGIAIKLANGGLPKFYESSTSNMPVGMLYLMWFVGGFSTIANVQFGTIGMGILIRLPMIIADIVSCYMIFSIASKHNKNSVATCYAGIWAILPAIFTASASWGMQMSICIAFLIATFINITEKKPVKVAIYYLFAILFDYIAVLLAPLVLGYLLCVFINNRKMRMPIGASVGGGFVGFYLISLPFAIDYVGKGNVFFVFKKMVNYFMEMALFTKDVFGLYGMIAQNGKVAPYALVVLNFLFIFALGFIGIYLYVRNKNRLTLLLSASFVMITASIIGAKAYMPMLILGVALLFVYASLCGERRIFHLSTAFSALAFINISQVLAQSGYLSGNPNANPIMFNATSPIMIIFSIIALGLYGYFAYLMYDIGFLENEKPITSCDNSLVAEIKRISNPKYWFKKK